MKNISYKKGKTYKLNIKGTMSGDGSFITYYDDEGGDVTMELAKCGQLFAGQDVVLSISYKNDEDCTQEIDGELLDEEEIDE